MGWYKEGKVNVVAGQTSVTGVGTNFAANTLTGDAFIGPDGQWYEVINVPSPTTLSISPAYRSATVSNASYALMPVQGYQRDLAIAASNMLQQWGSTLAGLGTVSTENVVPVNKGGTGGATAALARAGLELKTGAVADVEGIATAGAIIERGSNTYGTYVKFAGGLLIGFGLQRSPTIAANTYAMTTVLTYPHQFLAGTFPSVSGIAYGLSSADHYGMYDMSAYTANRHISGTLAIRNGGTAQFFDVRYMVIGVWK
ncbi:phage tail protein [Pseudomonas [fluorescens] ATCC 17400]